MDENFIEQQYSGKPFMGKEEIAAIDYVFMQKIKQGRKIVCFEWGSGGSTKYYVDMLTNSGIDFEWHVAEHHPGWAVKVQENIISDKLFFNVFDYGKYTRFDIRKICMKDYVRCPLNVNKKFDVMIVDGRSRRRCILIAKEVLNKDGAVFLHDANREHYKSILDTFPYHGIVAGELWRGSFEQL